MITAKTGNGSVAAVPARTPDGLTMPRISPASVDFAAQPSDLSVNARAAQADSLRPRQQQARAQQPAVASPTRGPRTCSLTRTSRPTTTEPQPRWNPQSSSRQAVGNYLATSGDSCWPLTGAFPSLQELVTLLGQSDGTADRFAPLRAWLDDHPTPEFHPREPGATHLPGAGSATATDGHAQLYRPRQLGHDLCVADHVPPCGVLARSLCSF
jgi:hypothetical protein